MVRRTLGLDIGGANLKAADGRGWAASIPFALWREPNRLADHLARLLASHPQYGQNWTAWDIVAITMTGELCDCFTDRKEGTDTILNAVDELLSAVRRLVWSNRGEFLTPDQARARPLEVASANWLATAYFCGKFLTPGREALVIDIGSTTTDVIPLCNGQPVPIGRTDLERLRSGELVYRGVRRTPLMALAGHVSFQGRFTNLMAEQFATTHDVYVLLGDLPEEPSCTQTADGQPATKAFARRRLARMVGTDADLHPGSDLQELAGRFDDLMRKEIRNALWRVVAHSLPGSRPVVFVCGIGEFLARRVLAESGLAFADVISLSERLGPNVSEAICAHALARLAERSCHGETR